MVAQAPIRPVLSSVTKGAAIVPLVVFEKFTVPPAAVRLKLLIVPEPNVNVAATAPGVTTTDVAPEPIVSVPTVSVVAALDYPTN